MTTTILERLTSALTGRYTVEREIGRGGMAAVFLAHDENNNRPVAIKVMLPEAVGDVGPERFRREIQLAARLGHHPNIVTVYDSGELDQIFYYVMPFIDGESVSDFIRTAGRLNVSDAVAIAQRVADALQFAHTEGIIHRDIKPGNILLARSQSESGEVLLTPIVTDFGIARAISGEGAARLTSTGLMIGTPTYMSPEQCWGERQLDGRADQYSLACVLYEMLVGEPPFTGPTIMTVIARQMREAMPSLRVVRPSIPERLEAAIRRALSKASSDRFQTIAEFAAAISTAVEGPIEESTADYEAPASPNSQVFVRGATRPRGVLTPTAAHRLGTRVVDTYAPTTVVRLPSVPEETPGAGSEKPANPLVRWMRRAMDRLSAKGKGKEG